MTDVRAPAAEQPLTLRPDLTCGALWPRKPSAATGSSPAPIPSRHTRQGGLRGIVELQIDSGARSRRPAAAGCCRAWPGCLKV